MGRKVIVQPNGCWAYRGDLDHYARVDGMPAHRWFYEILVEPVDADLHLHHECLNPGCVNPKHLLPLTPKEHAQRHAELRRTA